VWCGEGQGRAELGFLAEVGDLMLEAPVHPIPISPPSPPSVCNTGRRNAPSAPLP